MNPSGYRAGYYGDPTSGSLFRLAYCGAVAAQPAIGSGSFIWSFQPSGTRSVKPGLTPYAPNTPGCAAQVFAWQYAIAPNNNAPNVDTDEVQLALPMW